MALNYFPTRMNSIESPPTHAVAVTPDDDNDLTHVTRYLYVGGTGNVKVTMQGGETVVLTGLVQGHMHPIRVSRVHSTDTTATAIIGLF